MSLSAASIEIETIKTFVIATKRERYAAFILNPKRRKEFVRSLAHFADFEPRNIVRISKAEQSKEKIKQMLVDRGSPATCHVISEWSKLDGLEMDLYPALKEIIGSGMGTLLCCVPAKLAYFENEDDRYILQSVKNPAEKSA